MADKGRVKDYIEEKYNHAFIPYVPRANDILYHIADTNAKWYRLSDVTAEGVKKNGDYVINAIMREIDACLKNTYAKAYISIHDKRRYTPLAKAPTWIKSSVVGEEDGVAKPMDKPLDWSVPKGEEEAPQPLIHPNQPLPDWKRLKVNKSASDYAKSEAYDYVVEHYKPPNGKKFIIDGAMVFPLKGELLPVDTPTCVETRNGVTESYPMAEYSNKIGEADNCIYFWIEKLSDPQNVMKLFDGLTTTSDGLVESSDVDVLLSALLHGMSRMNKDGQFINNLYILHKGRKLRKNGAIVSDDTIIDVNVLYQAIELEIGSIIKHPVANLVVACYAGGNDYVRDDADIVGVNHKSFLDGFYDNLAEIGTMVVLDQEKDPSEMIRLDYEAYCRFLVAAYKSCKNYGKRLNKLKKARGHDKITVRDVITAVAQSNAKREEYHINPDALALNFKATSWAVLYYTLTPYGYEVPSFIGSGWGLIDPDKGLVAGNVALESVKKKRKVM